MTSQGRDSAPAAILDDELAGMVGPEDQRMAAHMAQDAFARIFRLTLTEDDEGRARGVNELSDAIRQWAGADTTEESASLRLALLLSGLDQWGVAYSRAFGLQAIPGLTELVGALRAELGPQAEARFEQQYGAIEAAEGNAIDFKIELRRGIHLALWHAMIASDERDQATAILIQLGGMLFSLVRLMPEHGWRLVADALANIQIRCLAEGLATHGLAQEMTESLFAALSQELPAARRDLIMAHSARSVLAWQEARRSPPGQVH